MPVHRSTPAAMELWMRGAQALSVVESNGCRIDKTYLDTAITEVSKRIADLEAQVRSDKHFAIWRRRFGDKTKPTSYDQLAAVVYRELGFTSSKKTEGKKRESAAKESLAEVDLPLVRNFIAAAELRKARDTYLVGIRRELVQHDDGCWYVHPSYSLNTVITFRSSANSPNYTNIPNRNPEIAEIVRRCYIPRPGHQIGEFDYGQNEVRISVEYNQDPVLREYVCDPTKDMHRDMACQIFKLKPKQVPKALRTLVKGDYVFATFYGSYYKQTAKALWDAVDSEHLKLEGSGVTVRQHLTDLGFTELGNVDKDNPDEPEPGTWAAWIRHIDDDFWNKRFKGYAQWKRDWYEAYLRDGGFIMLTGFAVNVPLDKKQVVNAPPQGTSFHCLLWSLIKLIEWLQKYRMRTVMIGEIHDAMTGDVDPRERDDVFHAASDIMTNQIKKWAPWLTVPLVAEAECCPIGESWFHKHALKEVGSSYVPANLEKWEKAHGAWALQCPDEQ